MFDLQTILVFMIVAWALLYVGRKVWRKVWALTKAGENSCANGCGKCSTDGAARVFSKIKNR